jgi:hypothetical protein
MSDRKLGIVCSIILYISMKNHFFIILVKNIYKII